MEDDRPSLKALSQRNFGRQAAAYAGNRLLADPENLNDILTLLELSAQDRVLDVATGTGFLAAAMARHAGEVLATDLTAGMLRKARAIIGSRPNVTYAIADAENLPFGDGGFGAVTCRVALHHFPDPAASIAEMVRVCRPDGRVMIMDIVSSEDPLKSAYHNRMERLRDRSHVKEYPLSALGGMIRTAGLRIQTIKLWRYTWPVEDWLAIADPDAATAEEVRRMMRESIAGDKSGLNVERRGEGLFFTYTAAIIVARKESVALVGAEGASSARRNPESRSRRERRMLS